MNFYLKITVLACASLGLLAACGGGKPPITDNSSSSSSSGSSSGSGSGSGSSGGSTTASGVSYLPLDVYEAYKEFSGASVDGAFQGSGDPVSPLVPVYMINPVDAATLATISTAVAGDYKVTVDDIAIEADEAHPTLQRIIGSQVSLRTALVFDISDSMYDIDIDALVQAAKDYVAAAQSSSNSTIKNQEFVVWDFAKDIQERTSGFTTNAATINSALDQVAADYKADALGLSSNLNGAIIKAVGRYTANAYDFSADGDNDLVDSLNLYQVNLSQMVVFSSGADTYAEFTKELMGKAIQSQSFLKYDPTADASTNTMVNLNKPVFYYVVGGASGAGSIYSDLSALSEVTTALPLSGGAYSFASGLITNQIAAMDKRVDLNNLYAFRFVFLPRVGDHTVIFSSNSTGHSYSLKTDFKESSISSTADVVPVVEITGPNGEYLAFATASLSNVQTFKATTRWNNDPHTYVWTPGGTVTGTTNADGSFTVTGGTGSLTASNGVQSTAITITN